MSSGELFLFDMPSIVLWEFCRVMDVLSDLDWTRFASMVLDEQTVMRLAEKKENRTDWVMNQWGSRNGRVSELINLLEGLELLRPRDVILKWVYSLNPPPTDAPHPRPPPLNFSPSQFLPPPKPSNSQSTSSPSEHDITGRLLPRPAPPPSQLQSKPLCPTPHHHPPTQAQCTTGLMCWSYEEVHGGTEGFSPSRQVGEGGFGVVYKATLKNTIYAVKILKQDCLLDWSLLKESFQTEVEKLSKFRHPNIIELLGFSKGPESLCLIYSYMENKSLEYQLHNESMFLSWFQRVNVVKGTSTALQFLHGPPNGNRLIHGDVKSSNILLDCHMMAKLGDFGLARFTPRSSSRCSASQTMTVGQTATVRGTLAYLPDEYVRDGKLGTAVDVYSFGVVLLEVLTGRRALEKDRKSGERYLKALVDEVEDSPADSLEAVWRKQLDHRLITGGASEPACCMEMVALACKCLERNRKKRPIMTVVCDKLQDIHNFVKTSSSCSHQHSSQSLHRPTIARESSVGTLSQALSKLGPLEDTYQPSQSSRSSSSSSSSSSFCSLTSTHPLCSSSALSPTSSSRSLSASPFALPCETDESRGFSQYDLHSQIRANGTSSRALCPSPRDQYHSPTTPSDSQFNQHSVPTEDQYNFPAEPCSTGKRSGAQTLSGTSTGPDDRSHILTGATAGVCNVPKSLSPVRSLQSVFPGTTVLMNPSKQHFLQKKTMYEEGLIQTPELLSSDDLYGEMSSLECRGPEESNELDFLPAKHQ